MENGPPGCMLFYLNGGWETGNLVGNIKTHGSESRGQEEAGLRDEPVSYLQVAPLRKLLTL